MIRFYLLLTLLFLSACSFKTPDNKWQHNSANYFQLYTKNFLNANKVLAKSDLKVAIENAKRSADLTTLAKVYLGKCALDISVGINNDCQEYQDIALLVEDVKLEAYHHFLEQKMQESEFKLLPSAYQNFVQAIAKKDTVSAKKAIVSMEKITSQLLASALIKEELDKQSVAFILQRASYFGYKKAVLFWLAESKKYASNEEVKKIEKKIQILTKKE